MNNIILIIDPGHGGSDVGCRYNDLYEKDLTLKISLYQFKRFKELGINVAITRDKDIYLSPNERTKRVINSNAKYCISNHINAGGGEGCEVIHSIYNNGELAKKIFYELVASGLKGRRIFSRESTKYPKKDYYFMHRNTGNCTTNIVEYGFIDNKEDREKIINNWEKYAECVVKGFCMYINHEYKEPNKVKDIDDIEFKKSINILSSKNIINTPEYWLNNKEYNPEYVKELIKKVARLL